MIGNDVVDLGDPETRPGGPHPRFDARVFDGFERAELRASRTPNRLRWAFWAAKEAAYKLARKLDPGTAFSPARFAVRLDASLWGEVRHDGGPLRVRVSVRGACIHAIANEAEARGRRILSAVEALPAPPGGEGPDPSEAARSLAVKTVARGLGLAIEDLVIARRDRIPTLVLRGESTELDLSLSHHGRFVAFACDLGRNPNRG